MRERLPRDWSRVLEKALSAPSFERLEAFLGEERRRFTIYPSEEDMFSAFRLTPYEQVRVMVLGQDPYHGPGQAHGLAFSVQPGVPSPPSLVNIFKELQSDLGLAPSGSGSLVPWAQQGVLLLNAVLTVRESQPNSHANQGWEDFTDEVIRAVSAKREPMVFLLWGNYARKKKKLIDTERHEVIESPHPSPLSAMSGFFGSRPFSRINEALMARGKPAIDWSL